MVRSLLGFDVVLMLLLEDKKINDDINNNSSLLSLVATQDAFLQRTMAS
jgi:hypothetical protein